MRPPTVSFFFSRKLCLVPSCHYQAPYHANHLLPRLDHTPLAAVDCARGEHFAKAGPMRVLTPEESRVRLGQGDKALGSGLANLHRHSGHAASQVLSQGTRKE